MHYNGIEITISDCERQPCEVWTRAVGYFRPISNFNIGRLGEHRERRYYSLSEREMPLQEG